MGISCSAAIGVQADTMSSRTRILLNETREERLNTNTFSQGVPRPSRINRFGGRLGRFLVAGVRSEIVNGNERVPIGCERAFSTSIGLKLGKTPIMRNAE
jgi:hypothetical protein